MTDKARDRYYQRRFGISLRDYEEMFEDQKGCCGICKRPQATFKNRLAVDHDHGFKKIEIKTTKHPVDKMWTAWVEKPANYACMSVQIKKADAVRSVKAMLKTKSVRGLLCPWCNRGLRYYADDPKRLQGAADYLRRFSCA